MKARRVGAVVALGVGALSVSRSARAAEGAPAPARSSEDARPRGDERSPPPDPSVRLDLGLGLGWVALAPAAGQGAVGGLVGPLPMARLAVEPHLLGPAWLTIRAQGGYARTREIGGEAEAYSANLSVGPRFDVPVHDVVEVGGFARAEGSFSMYDHPLEPAIRTLAVGGVAGASLHFRTSPLFGVRLDVDVLRGGYARSSQGVEDGYVGLAASPWVSLTFTF